MTEESTLQERIIDILSRNGGLKAKQIAQYLRVERSDVNSLLYGKLQGRVVSDSKYQWYLRENAPEAVAQADALPETPLSKLCRYYLDCLTHGDSEGVSVFATSKYDLDYCELEDWPFAPEAGSPFSSDEARSLLGRVRKAKFEKTVFLGYPVFLRRHQSRKGEFTFVEPLFLFSCEFDPNDRYKPPTLQGDLPWLNLKALDHLPTDAGDSPLQESIRLAELLNIDRPGIDPADFDEVVARLRAERADWRWIEDPDPYDIPREPGLSEVSEAGIYNRVVLVAAERSGYTWGLETELNKLMRLEEAEYRDTALGQWLSNDQLSSSVPPNQPLLEVLPLNSEQREATLQGLHNDLTVVTGPPGTGKSQVVTSVLVNAAWQDTKVLFASRNNKAVDVVEERVNSLGPRPILLRTGNTEYQQALGEYLSSLLSAKATDSDRTAYERARSELEKIRTRFQALDAEIEAVIELRNRVDELEQPLEEAREVLGETCFQSIKSADTTQIRRSANELQQVADRAVREKQPFLVRLLWPLFRGSRFRDLSQAVRQSREPLEQLNLSAPDVEPTDGTIHRWEELADQMYRRSRLASEAKKYFLALEELQAARPLEDLQREQFELIGEMSETSQEVWNRWLALQPARLSQSDRRLLGEYATQIKLLVSAAQDNRRAGSKVYRRYYELFPKITQFLPCWAVTNLTARRIPFQPGFFDVVVVDEASQCDIASALPLLFRAKRAVIIGDPKQLRHISGISEKQDQVLLEKHDLAESHLLWSYSANSLYDLASHLCRSEDVVALRDHHRSHADIINFSNQHFYHGNLRVATQYDRLQLLDGQPAVRWRHVEGRVTRPRGRSALNQAEAEEVVRELERVVVEQGYPGSVGVVTPFRAHANRIRDLVSRNDDLTRALAGREFIPDTAHAFQGDERDLMIFSPVVSPGISNPALWFLRNNGYLFNVAITRARGALVVVGNQSAAKESGVDYLEAFVDYAHRVEGSPEKDGSEAPATADLGPEYPTVTHPDRVSDWERVLYEALYRADIRTIPQYNVEKYALDLALIDGDRRLDIEVDGERYHRRWDGELVQRDRIRNFRLTELGWDVMRFWVYEVRDDLSSCVERVREWQSGAP